MPSTLDYAALACPPRADAPRTVLGLLLNYRQSLEALGDSVNEPPYKAPPKAPVLYIKPANTYAADGDAIPLPGDVSEVTVGACLAVEFDRTTRKVSEAEALEYVAGYRVVADLYVPHDMFYRPAIKQKCRDHFCPIGQLTPRASVVNPDALTITVAVDGQTVQTANTQDLIRSVRRSIVDVSQFMTFEKGDLLLVGVPFGAPTARAGQEYRIEIEQVGVLTNRLTGANA